MFFNTNKFYDFIILPFKEYRLTSFLIVLSVFSWILF